MAITTPEVSAADRAAIDHLRAAHREWAGAAEPVIVRAPGRVNLIGEHVDYHGGLVLPAAISLCVYAAATRRDDERRRLRSLDEPLVVETGGEVLESATLPRWALHPMGVIDSLERATGPFAGGFDVLYATTLPRGAGLSSSAAIEVATGLAVAALFDREVEPRALALLVQEAETRSSGVKVGIMDPLAVLLGQPGKALLVDCATLAVRAVALPLADFAVAICDSGRPRQLAGAAYNQRRQESQEAVEALEKGAGFSLGGRRLTPEVLGATITVLQNPMHRRRLSHIASENERVERCVDAIEAGDMAAVRELFTRSHRSLRFDYEVSTPELDALVEIARDVHPLVAARLTGAGFGGSTVNLVPREALPRFLEEVPRRFAERFPGAVPEAAARAFEVEIAGGACRVA